MKSFSIDIKLIFEGFFCCFNGAFASDEASNVKKIGKDKSDDTLAYEDNAHKYILRTFGYFLKIVTHISQGWSSGLVIMYLLFWIFMAVVFSCDEQLKK